MTLPNLTYATCVPLQHKGDCSLIGVTPDLTLYTEEIYGDGFVAQQATRLDGAIIERVDEGEHSGETLMPLALPDGLRRPQTAWHTMSLNFSGPRHRGLSGLERLLDLVRPLSIQDKMALASRFSLSIPPPLIFGLAESYVLSEAALVHPDVYVVCRRLRIAYGLAQEQLDADQEPYDYDTMVLYAAHIFDRAQQYEPSIADMQDALPEAALKRPMDCLICNGHLFVADGGSEERLSAVHVWQIEPLPDEGDDLHRKLYV
jgi:hypothetical protein